MLKSSSFAFMAVAAALTVSAPAFSQNLDNNLRGLSPEKAERYKALRAKCASNPYKNRVDLKTFKCVSANKARKLDGIIRQASYAAQKAARAVCGSHADPKTGVSYNYDIGRAVCVRRDVVRGAAKPATGTNNKRKNLTTAQAARMEALRQKCAKNATKTRVNIQTGLCERPGPNNRAKNQNDNLEAISREAQKAARAVCSNFASDDGIESFNYDVRRGVCVAK